VEEHNAGVMKSTKSHRPWRLVFFAAFETLKKAKDFELYLKSGSGKAFAYKRLVSVALKKDISEGRQSVPKS
jgi:predicted GIY-YIG superfamily endonuclease